MPFFSRKPPPAPPRYLIVGLGNPGPEYRHTRHNVGFEVIDRLAERHKIAVQKLERRALVGFGQIAETSVQLAKPMTFMNLSGDSISPMLKFAGLTPADLIVIVDDMDLPVGKLRLRKAGSAGGHNGLKSLIYRLGTEEFFRIRLGVGRPSEGAVIDHVLSKFGRNELEPIAQGIDRAADAVETAVSQGFELAMNRFNPAGG